MKTRIAIIAVLSLIVASFFFGRSTVKQKDPEITVKHDTVVHTDTVHYYYPVHIYSYSKQTVHDTLYTQDSSKVVVNIPITAKVYKDSTYRAVISGYRASLDSIQTYQKTKVITNTITVIKPVKTSKKWAVSVQAGYGITFNKPSPYVGIGISRSLIAF